MTNNEYRIQEMLEEFKVLRDLAQAANEIFDCGYPDKDLQELEYYGAQDAVRCLARATELIYLSNKRHIEENKSEE